MTQNPPETGVFPACFLVSRNLPGGATLSLKWLVNPMNNTISGSGHITQAINPPTDISVEMSGHFQSEGDKIRVVAGGARPGASIQVSMLIEGWSGSGVADIRWLANNQYFSDNDVPVEPATCFPGE